MMDLIMIANITAHTDLQFSGWSCALERNGVHIIAYSDVSLIPSFMAFKASILVGIAVAIAVAFGCFVYCTARHCIRRHSYTVNQDNEETHCPIEGLPIPDDDFLHNFTADCNADISNNGLPIRTNLSN